MATLERAIALAASVHAGQRDKQGKPYILHPLRVMLHLADEAAQIVAVLHDTIEDTDLTEDDLRREGFSDEVVAAVCLVTHRKHEPYADYVVRCAGNPLARQVKLSDLEDNTRLDRALMRPEQLQRDLSRMGRYLLSYQFLIGSLNETEYRQAMATHA